MTINIELYTLAAIMLVLINVLLIGLGYLIRVASKKASAGNGADAEAQLAEAQLAMRKELDAMNASLKTLHELIKGLDSRLTTAQEQSPPVLSEHQQASRKTFEVAAKLSLQGADTAELVKVCGLTQGEAELIRMLHVARNAGHSPFDINSTLSATAPQWLKDLQEPTDNHDRDSI